MITGFRRDKNYFNEESVELPQSADDICLEYDKEYFGESKNESLCKPHLIRNGQFICSFDLPDVNISNRRGNAKSMFQIRHVKCCLVYDPFSKLDNKQDLLCGIQENKNQCACLLEIRFSRLIQCIKKKKSDEIWDYFEKTVKNNKEKQDALIKEAAIVSQEEDTEKATVVVFKKVYQEEVSQEEECSYEEPSTTALVIQEEECSYEEPSTTVLVLHKEESSFEEPSTTALVLQEESEEETVQTNSTVVVQEEESSDEELIDMPVVIATVPQKLTQIQLLEENKQLLEKLTLAETRIKELSEKLTLAETIIKQFKE